MSKPSLREELLDAGLKVMFRSRLHGGDCARCLRSCSRPAGLLHQSLPLQRGVCQGSPGPVFCRDEKCCQKGFGGQVSDSAATTNAVSGPHQRAGSGSQMEPGLHDRRFQPLRLLHRANLCAVDWKQFSRSGAPRLLLVSPKRRPRAKSIHNLTRPTWPNFSWHPGKAQFSA